MNRAQIQILIIEDSEADILLLQDVFGRLSDFNHDLAHAERLAEGLARLHKQHFDVVLLDLGLPDSQGVETFIELHRQAPNVPVLVLTALDDESVGVRAMKLGAQDYLIKNQVQPALLARSVRYAIERQRATAELLQSQQQLRNLAARLQEVREAERTHIAREVHDELGQMLTALKMDLRWVEKRLNQRDPSEDVVGMTQKVVGAENLVDRSIEAVQRIALELRPSSLDNLGLTEAIRDEARRFEARTGIHLTISLPANLPKLRNDIATAFFRVFQELLTNVARHANATTVAVHLAVVGEGTELTIHDDGRGIPLDAISRKTSLGLLGMSERAISLGGRIQFEGAPNKGTRARLRIPNKQHDRTEL